MLVETCPEASNKIGDTRAELGWEIISVGFPIRSDEKLFGVPGVGGLSKEELNREILAKAFKVFVDDSARSGGQWSETEVETET
jgi:hypothetical protein